MEIQIFGETLTIKHSLRVQHLYEKILNIPFNAQDLTMTENRVVLCYATIAAYNPDTKITIDAIEDADFETVQTLDKAVLSAFVEWRNIPEPTNDPALTEEHTDEEKKV